MPEDGKESEFGKYVELEVTKLKLAALKFGGPAITASAVGLLLVIILGAVFAVVAFIIHLGVPQFGWIGAGEQARIRDIYADVARVAVLPLGLVNAWLFALISRRRG